MNLVNYYSLRQRLSAALILGAVTVGLLGVARLSQPDTLLNLELSSLRAERLKLVQEEAEGLKPRKPRFLISAADRKQWALFFGRRFGKLGWSKARTARFTDVFVQTSELYQLDPIWIAGLMHVESRFKPDALSREGAVGLLQLIPSTALIMAREAGMLEGDVDESEMMGMLEVPEFNLRLGVRYLAKLVGRYQGSLERGLAAYLMGPGVVDAWIAQRQDRSHGLRYVSQVVQVGQAWRREVRPAHKKSRRRMDRVPMLEARVL